MFYADFTLSFKMLEREVYRINKGKDRKNRVKRTEIDTMKKLITFYCIQLTDLLPKELNSLKANNKGIASQVNSTTRTVQRHLKKLVEVGLIAKKNHGAKANFEVWISPKILFINEQVIIQGVFYPQSYLEKFGFSSKFSDPQIIVNEYITNTTTTNSHLMLPEHYNNSSNNEGYKEFETQAKDTEKKDHSEGVSNDFLNSLSRIPGNTAGDTNKEDRLTAKNKEKKEKSCAKKEKNAPANFQDIKTPAFSEPDEDTNEEEGILAESRPNTQKGFAPLGSNFSNYIADFWYCCLTTIYKFWDMSEVETQAGLLHIANLYCVEEPFLEKRHDELMIQLNEVIRYVERHENNPNKGFVPRPSKFFDPHNSKGFAGAKIWVVKTRKKAMSYKQKVNETKYRKIMERYFRLRKDDKHSPIDLWQKTRFLVEELGDKGLTEKFLRATSTQMFPQIEKIPSQKQYKSNFKYKNALINLYNNKFYARK